MVWASNHSLAEVVVRAFNHSPAEAGNQPPVPITTSVTVSACYDEESSLWRGLSIPGRYRGICGASPDVPFCWA